ncbi:LAFA_0F01552g1_1 [Lachancea sp. 'fantastica']|nr:LAFA_0F01552g1_1 [Lachancea sp. 'fantastica']
MDSNEIVRHDSQQQDAEDVIEIESCAEDEAEIQNATELRQNPTGPRRDWSGRFTPAQTNGNRQNAQEDANEQHNDNDDDLEVVDEIVIDDGGPLDPNAEYVDLDNERPFTVAQIRPRQPSTGSGQEDDDVVFVGQNTTNASFVLNLPGGDRVLFSGSPLELPVRRSFQHQVPRALSSHLNSRRRRAQRVAAGAQQALNAPMTASNQQFSNFNEQRRRNEMRLRRSTRHMQQNARRHTPFSSPSSFMGHSNPANFQSQLSMLPVGVRAAFDEALSIDEFQSVLEARDRESYEQRLDELTTLYAQYREIVENSREPNPSNEPRAGRNMFHWAQALGTFAGHNGGRQHGLARAWVPPQYAGIHTRDTDDSREIQGIMELIEARNEAEVDSKKRKLMESTKGKRMSFLEDAKKLPEGYSSSFDVVLKLEMPIRRNKQTEIISVEDDEATEIEIPACTLCGVELGVGIPEGYEGRGQSDDNRSFSELVEKYKFHCPYQSLRRFTVADRDLSRETYVASCGHMFCGRCLARIRSARKVNEKSAKKFRNAMGPSHPDNCGPRQCPAENCKNKLRQNSTMHEVFF